MRLLRLFLFSLLKSFQRDAVSWTLISLQHSPLTAVVFSIICPINSILPEGYTLKARLDFYKLQEEREHQGVDLLIKAPASNSVSMVFISNLFLFL